MKNMINMKPVNIFVQCKYIVIFSILSFISLSRRITYSLYYAIVNFLIQLKKLILLLISIAIIITIIYSIYNCDFLDNYFVYTQGGEQYGSYTNYSGGNYTYYNGQNPEQGPSPDYSDLPGMAKVVIQPATAEVMVVSGYGFEPEYKTVYSIKDKLEPSGSSLESLLQSKGVSYTKHEFIKDDGIHRSFSATKPRNESGVLDWLNFNHEAHNEPKAWMRFSTRISTDYALIDEQGIEIQPRISARVDAPTRAYYKFSSIADKYYNGTKMFHRGTL